MQNRKSVGNKNLHTDFCISKLNMHCFSSISGSKLINKNKIHCCHTQKLTTLTFFKFFQIYQYLRGRKTNEIFFDCNRDTRECVIL